MEGSSSFSQLRYIDKNGFEKIRVDNKDGEYVVYNSNDLQDKSDRYYFIDAMKLGYDEVYITKMDLNIEYGEIENVGTKENPIYVPMIRFSAPVFNKNLEKEGVIVLNVYADNLMTEIDNAAPKDNIFLVNNEGYYLYNTNSTKEFGFMFLNNETFFNDYGLKKDFFSQNIKNHIVKINETTFLVDFIYFAIDFLNYTLILYYVKKFVNTFVKKIWIKLMMR
mgnify:CR=1 FL=1